MSGASLVIHQLKLIASSAVFALVTGASLSHATEMTAGVIAKEMSAEQRFSYIFGLVDGLAYARFRADSEKAGHKVQDGMNCIYKTFFEDQAAGVLRIENAFRSYPDNYPAAVVTAIIKKECGE